MPHKEDGKTGIDAMISRRLELKDIDRGFDLGHAGTSIRSMVVYSGNPGRNTL